MKVSCPFCFAVQEFQQKCPVIGHVRPNASLCISCQKEVRHDSWLKPPHSKPSP